jgi:hypothetical protein
MFSDLFPYLATRTFTRAGVTGPQAPWENAFAFHACPEGSRCPEHISALKDLGSRRISGFYAHFLELAGRLATGNIYMLW